MSEEFDIASIPDHAHCFIIGHRRCGKSVMERNILFHKQHIPAGIGCAPLLCQHGLRELIPKAFIYSSCVSATEAVFDRARHLIRAKSAEKMFLLLDECIFSHDEDSKKFWRKGLWQNLGHYRNIFAVYTNQHSPDEYRQIDERFTYAFLFHERVAAKRKHLYICFAQHLFQTLEEFESAMDSVCVDYRCLVITPTGAFHYTADPTLRSFTLGSKEYWESGCCAVDNDSDPDDDFI